MAAKALSYVIKFMKDGTSYESTKTVGPTDIPAIDSAEWATQAQLCECLDWAVDTGNASTYIQRRGVSGLVVPGEPIPTQYDLKFTFSTDDHISFARQSTLQTDTISSTATALLAKPRYILGAMNVAAYDSNGTLVDTMNFRCSIEAQNVTHTRGEAVTQQFVVQVIHHANNKIKLPA